MLKHHFEVVSFEPKLLLGVAEEINRERLLKVASALKKEGLSLSHLPSSKILDYLYAVDSVFRTEDADGNEIVVGVDITANYTSADSKLRKLTNPKMKSMLKAIGIDLVVIVICEQNKTYSQMTSEEQYRFAYVVLEQVDSMQIMKKWVDEVIISPLTGQIK